MNALVARVYTTSERTAATKHGGIDESSFRRNNDLVGTKRPVRNDVSPHFVGPHFGLSKNGCERLENVVRNNRIVVRLSYIGGRQQSFGRWSYVQWRGPLA